jgi:hypothetical protein
MRLLLLTILFLPLASFLTSCGTGSFGGGPPNMGGPTAEQRRTKIANEPTGNFYYGRRYHVFKTRFWGYLREPRESWSKSKLVVFNEAKGRQPDRLPETGPPGQRYGYDNNYNYRINGYYTGDTVYEINSNQFLPEFMLTGYEQLERNPGWLFSPDDHYDPEKVTLLPGY